MDDHDDLRGSVREPAARTALAELAGRLTTGGDHPWQVALVDQHAAEVRDALLDAAGRLPVVRLAAYADGVLDSAERRGWRLDESGATEWPMLRLRAICALLASAV
ncbi:DUF6401 family natural product biosynthesis protein [Dactylosporangium sp. NPDC000521]|uniref:DUF6401 family natural product biosynthesis protein n=1 Tax=Dactylosporangium sp. NPDC000521 TaxID=3363975 RepID=UPI003695FE87